MDSRQLSRQIAPRVAAAGLHLDLGDLAVTRLDTAWSTQPIPTNVTLVDAPERGEDASTYPRVEWQWAAYEFDSADVQEGDCLGDFLALADLEGHALGFGVCGFVARWGHLNVCRHGILAATHLPCSRDAPLGRRVERTTPLDFDEDTGPVRVCFDPISAYGTFSRGLRALISIAIAHSQGSLARVDDWEALFACYPSVPAVRPSTYMDDPARAEEMTALSNWNLRVRFMRAQLRERSVKNDRDQLRDVLEGFWVAGAVRARPWVGGGEVTIFWEHKGALGLLVVQMMRMLEGLPRGGEYVCSGCGVRFLPTRRPAAGRRSWCPSCGRGRKQAEHARRKRARG